MKRNRNRRPFRIERRAIPPRPRKRAPSFPKIEASEVLGPIALDLMASLRLANGRFPRSFWEAAE